MKEPRRQVYIQRVGLFLPPPSRHSTRVYDVPGTHNVGLPTQYRFNNGPGSQPIAGSMTVNRIRRWHNIETELGDCPVFALTAIRVTLYAPKGHYPDNTIHRLNCEIILGDAGPVLLQPKPFKLLTTNIIVNIFFSEDFFKHGSTSPKDLKRYIAHVHKDWCTEMSTVSHTQYPSVLFTLE